MSLRRQPVRNLIVAGLLFLASGSLLSASGSSSSSERAVESAVRRTVIVGETSRAELVRRFGQPATQALRRAPGEVEIVGYNHEVIARPPFRLLPLLSFPRRNPADTFFEITDGIVTRFWTERR
jgi:hypothetical protein